MAPWCWLIWPYYAGSGQPGTMCLIPIISTKISDISRIAQPSHRQVWTEACFLFSFPETDSGQTELIEWRDLIRSLFISRRIRTASIYSQSPARKWMSPQNQKWKTSRVSLCSIWTFTHHKFHSTGFHNSLCLFLMCVFISHLLLHI